LSGVNVLSQNLSQEMKDIIRDTLVVSEDEASRLLDGYVSVTNLIYKMLDDIGMYSQDGSTSASHSSLGQLVRDLGPMLRAKDELERELYRISRPTRTEDDKDEDRREEDQRLRPKEIKRKERAANFEKNRQHRNRASKRHDDVSSESPSQNS